MVGDFTWEGGWFDQSVAPLRALVAEFTSNESGNATLSTTGGESPPGNQISCSLVGVELSTGITADLAILTKYGNDLMDEAGTALSGKADFEVPAPIVGSLTAQISNAGASVSGKLVLYVRS